MKLLAAVALALTVAACGGQESGVPLTNPDDISVILKEVDGTTYRCLYVYRKAGYHGGPAMWCERLES